MIVGESSRNIRRARKKSTSQKDCSSIVTQNSEASGGLEKYTAGGTLALLPRNAPWAGCKESKKKSGLRFLRHSRRLRVFSNPEGCFRVGGKKVY